MQNKPNFQKSQVNVNLCNTTDYENKSDWTLGENKPNLVRRLVRRSFSEDGSLGEGGTNPICQRVKLMQSVYLQRIMKKNADMGYEKTKPIQTQFQKSQK